MKIARYVIETMFVLALIVLIYGVAIKF